MNGTNEIAASPPIVVVVDDDPAVCGSLKFSLELEGFSVRAYHSGTALMAAGGLENCACFVVDQALPDTNGMELIAGLRARKFSAPTILIVGHPHASLAVQAAKRGIPLIEKPLLGNTLLQKIKEACGSS